MKFNYFIAVFVLLFAFNSCQKDETGLTDDQLIEAIQKATNKKDINFTDLPNPSKTIIDSDYKDLTLENAFLAPELGYEVNMVDDNNYKDMVRTKAYFDLSGRELKGKGDDTGGEKDGKKRCYSFVYPISFIVGDAIVTISSDEELREAKLRWKEAGIRPQLQYPVDIKMGDKLITLNNNQELKRVNKACKGDKDKRCFTLVFPVNFIAGDALITINDAEELKAAKARWKEAGIRPQLEYPVNIKWYEGTIQTVNNKDEMREAKKKCEGDNKKKCFVLLFPQTYIVGDAIVVINNREELKAAKKRWKEAGVRPDLQYPVDIKWYEGTIQTISSEEEMEAAKDKCDKDGDKD